MSKIDSFAHSKMYNIEFMNDTLSFDCYYSVFNKCKFQNIKFNFDNLIFRDNIFKDCSFEQCNISEIEYMKTKEIYFINCTLDGKKI
jgi:uncharacterized protein YjbI with pentapeptide repeats